MNVQFEQLTPTLGQLHISLHKEDYLPAFEKKIKEYSRTANIKGFRRGKVPPGLIQKLYGKSILAEEVYQLAVQQLYRYISEQQINTVGEPLPVEEKTQLDFDTAESFTFCYEIGMHTPIDYASVIQSQTKLTHYRIVLSEKDLDEIVDNIRQRNPQTLHPEQSEEGDFLLGKLESIDHDAKQVEPLVLERAGIPISRIKENERSRFVGLNIGSSIELIPEDTFEDLSSIRYALGIFDEKQLEQYKSVRFRLVVEQISRQLPAALDEAFFKQVFPNRDDITDEATFRQAVRQEVENSYSKEAELILADEIADLLIERISFDLPHDFLKRWLKANNQQLSLEDIEKEYPRFEEFLRWSLIKQHIARQENIQVEESEIVEEAKAYLLEALREQGIQPAMLNLDLDSFARRYLSEDKKGENYRKMRDKVLERKLVAWIKTKLSLEQKTIDVEQYKALIADINTRRQTKAQQLA